jgi:hypothetical protein
MKAAINLTKGSTLTTDETALFQQVIDSVNTPLDRDPDLEPTRTATTFGMHVPVRITGFEEAWTAVRADFREDFRYLATHEQLSSDAAEWASDTFTRTTVTPVVSIKDGHATISYEPSLQSHAVKLAYVLLRLSATQGVRFGVCKRCNKLWFDLRTVAGRKRESFCSVKCTNAFTQSVYRKNKRKRAKAARAKK